MRVESISVGFHGVEVTGLGCTLFGIRGNCFGKLAAAFHSLARVPRGWSRNTRKQGGQTGVQ